MGKETQTPLLWWRNLYENERNLQGRKGVLNVRYAIKDNNTLMGVSEEKLEYPTQ